MTDFVHIFSKRGHLQCVFVHWRDLVSKSKSTAYLLENWNSSTTAPDALFSPWWASTESSDRLCCSSWSCFRCAAALSACTPQAPRVPTLGKSPFSPHEGFWCRRSTTLSSSWVSNLGKSTVKETNRSFDRSRSKFADPRYRPRGRITKSVTVTTAYNRTIFSGTAASAQYKMAKAALHLKLPCTCWVCGWVLTSVKGVGGLGGGVHTGGGMGCTYGWGMGGGGCTYLVIMLDMDPPGINSMNMLTTLPSLLVPRYLKHRHTNQKETPRVS